MKRLKRANYEWFILFTTRLSFLASNHIAPKSLGFLDINTGYAQYATFIAYHEIWKSPHIFKKFMELVGNDLDIKMHSPLALSKLFPKFITIPYPFYLSELDLVLFTSLFPLESTNIAPIGFPILSVSGDFDKIYLPYMFVFHDFQHLAILTSGERVFVSDTPLSLDKIKLMYNTLRTAKNIYSKVIRGITDKHLLEFKNTKDPLLQFYKHLLFHAVHETGSGLGVRLEYLLSSDPRFYFNFAKKNNFDEARKIFKIKDPDVLHVQVKEGEKLFHELVQRSLSPALIAELQSFSMKEPVRFPSFGSYELKDKPVHAITIDEAVNKGKKIPTERVYHFMFDLYSGKDHENGIYYYFFPSIESEEMDIHNSWVIRFSTRYSY